MSARKVLGDVKRVEAILEAKGIEQKREQPDWDSADCNVEIDEIKIHQMENLLLREHYVAYATGYSAVVITRMLLVRRGEDTLMDIELVDGKIQRVRVQLTDIEADRLIKRTSALLRRN